jgi:hypothetical protein
LARSWSRKAERVAQKRPANSAHELDSLMSTMRTSTPDGVLPGAQDDRDGTALLGVVDMDRQKAALVIMGVEQRKLLMAVSAASPRRSRLSDRADRPFRRQPLPQPMGERSGEADESSFVVDRRRQNGRDLMTSERLPHDVKAA